MFREAFQELMSWSNTSNPKPPIILYSYRHLCYLQTSVGQHNQYSD